MTTKSLKEATEMGMRFGRLMTLSYKVGAPYALVAKELEWLGSCPLEYTRPGFDYWMTGFGRIPTIHTMLQVDECITEFMWSDSPHICSTFHTVNIAMRCFTNALLNRFADLYRRRLYDAKTAAKIAMGALDVDELITTAWQDHLTATAHRKGITDIEAHMTEMESQAAQRLADVKKEKEGG
jgi:hypothetical protein